MPLATNLYVHYNDTRATKSYLRKYGKVLFERVNPFINLWSWRLYKFCKKKTLFFFPKRKHIVKIGFTRFLDHFVLVQSEKYKGRFFPYFDCPFTVCHLNFCLSNEKMDKTDCLSGRVLQSMRLFITPVPIYFPKLIILHVKNIFQSWDWQEDWMQLTPAAPRVADLMQNGKSQKFE